MIQQNGKLLDFPREENQKMTPEILRKLFTTGFFRRDAELIEKKSGWICCEKHKIL
jgi:hypothetical protein